MGKHHTIHVRRVYDPPQPDDGTRILVDRLWPRGLTKDAAALDHWLKGIAPSTELRRWYHSEEGDWEAFRTRYLAELNANGEAVEALVSLCREGVSTLLFSVKDSERNHALILREEILKHL